MELDACVGEKRAQEGYYCKQQINWRAQCKYSGAGLLLSKYCKLSLLQ